LVLLAFVAAFIGSPHVRAMRQECIDKWQAWRAKRRKYCVETWQTLRAKRRSTSVAPAEGDSHQSFSGVLPLPQGGRAAHLVHEEQAKKGESEQISIDFDASMNIDESTHGVSADGQGEAGMASTDAPADPGLPQDGASLVLQEDQPQPPVHEQAASSDPAAPVDPGPPTSVGCALDVQQASSSGGGKHSRSGGRSGKDIARGHSPEYTIPDRTPLVDNGNLVLKLGGF